jgi:hypothetical protein
MEKVPYCSKLKNYSWVKSDSEEILLKTIRVSDEC